MFCRPNSGGEEHALSKEITSGKKTLFSSKIFLIAFLQNLHNFRNDILVIFILKLLKDSTNYTESLEFNWEKLDDLRKTTKNRHPTDWSFP